MKAVASFIFFLKFVIFIATAPLFVILGTIALHELGHSAAATYFGCENTEIIVAPGRLPNTLISCQDSNNFKIIAFSGILTTTLFSLVLFPVCRGMPRYLSSLIIPIGIITALYDFSMVSIPGFIIIFLNFISYLCIALITIKIVILYCQESNKF